MVYKWLLSNEYADFHKMILATKRLIQQRSENVNSDKMVAEFTLGFWVMLFNRKYEKLLWKPLRIVFENLPKPERKRKNVSRFINKIRVFRNRIYHYEPICWNFLALKSNYQNLLTSIQWLDKEAEKWSAQYCGFHNVLNQSVNQLRNLGVKNIPKNDN